MRSESNKCDSYKLAEVSHGISAQVRGMYSERSAESGTRFQATTEGSWQPTKHGKLEIHVF